MCLVVFFCICFSERGDPAFILVVSFFFNFKFSRKIVRKKFDHVDVIFTKRFFVFVLFKFKFKFIYSKMFVLNFVLNSYRKKSGPSLIRMKRLVRFTELCIFLCVICTKKVSSKKKDRNRKR